MNDPYIAALEVEREGYARYGRDDRIAEVDAELKRARAAARSASSGETETATSDPADAGFEVAVPKKRTQRSR